MQTERLRFLDTNVLIYAESRDDTRKYQIALNTVIESSGNSGTCISNQILAEFSYQMGKAFTASELNDRISDYQKAFNTVAYTMEDIKTANQLSETYKLHFFDALIVATMKANNIGIIITENEKDFKKIPWIKIENPFR